MKARLWHIYTETPNYCLNCKNGDNPLKNVCFSFSLINIHSMYGLSPCAKSTSETGTRLSVISWTNMAWLIRAVVCITIVINVRYQKKMVKTPVGLKQQIHTFTSLIISLGLVSGLLFGVASPSWDSRTVATPPSLMSWLYTGQELGSDSLLLSTCMQRICVCVCVCVCVF